jgi:hypothetical protein
MVGAARQERGQASQGKVFGGYGRVGEYPVGKLPGRPRDDTEGAGQIRRLPTDRSLTGFFAF